TSNKVIETVKDVVNEVVDTVKETVDRARDSVRRATNDGSDKVKDIVDDVIDTATSAAGGAGNTIAAGFGALAAPIADIITNIELVLGMGFDAAMIAINRLPGLLDKLTSINLNTYVADGLRMYAANKALLLEIQKAEMEGH
ncbi:unnamed protein product, partial [marine sediment metagenome]